MYLTGISNGAAMAYRYACEGTYPIAAIGPVAGSFSYPCSKPHPVSVIAIHGLDGQHIPFTGGQGSKGVTNGSWASVPQTLDAFRTANNCKPPVAQKDGLLHRDISSCEQGREVELITIEGAGHQWPGGNAKKGIVQQLLSGDPPSTAMDATSALWNFFQRHTAPDEGKTNQNSGTNHLVVPHAGDRQPVACAEPQVAHRRCVFCIAGRVFQGQLGCAFLGGRDGWFYFQLSGGVAGLCCCAEDGAVCGSSVAECELTWAAYRVGTEMCPPYRVLNGRYSEIQQTPACGRKTEPYEKLALMHLHTKA